jgi:hypothetical protein
MVRESGRWEGRREGVGGGGVARVGKTGEQRAQNAGEGETARERGWRSRRRREGTGGGGRMGAGRGEEGGLRGRDSAGEERMGSDRPRRRDGDGEGEVRHAERARCVWRWKGPRVQGDDAEGSEKEGGAG